MYLEKPKLHIRQQAYRPGGLRTISLDTTPRCNMKCKHCYAETFAQVEPVDLDTLGRAFNECYELGVFHWVLQGGEPIADPERLEAILGMLHPDESYINVVSNGWAMTQEKIRWLKSLQVDKIAFSLDSGLEGEHDSNRRQGSHRRTLQAIDWVLAEGLLSSISVVVTHQSLHSEGFKKAYNIARDRKIRLDVQIAEPVGKWDGRRDVLITPEDAAYIKSLQQEGPLLPNGQRMVNRDIFSGEKDHCPAGVEFMGITADGQFLPCNFLQFSLGNIRDRSIREMRDELLKSAWFGRGIPHCLCGEDQGFIDAYILPYVGEKKPLNAVAVFKLHEGSTP